MCLSIKVKRPDAVLAEGEHAGFQWAVTHNGSGFRCGYVRVPAGHPWHGQSMGDVPADVHGGITFSEPDMPCTAPGPDDDWWVGFDCAHSFDAPDPALPNAMPRPYSWGVEVIASQYYVEAECRSLCEQAARADVAAV